MRLLFVTGSLVHGGAERHTITLANRLAERGHECHFAYVRNDPSQLERLRGMTSTQCLHAGGYFDFQAVQKLRQITKPTVVVAANQYALMYATLARLGAPILATFHSTRLRNAREWIQMLYYRPFFWAAERVVFVCEAQRRYWRRRGLAGRASEVIYNGIDTEYWAAAGAERQGLRRALGYADEDLVVGMSAVLRAEKNHLQMVDAVAMLRRRGVPARALLIGDGEMRAAIEARARAVGVGAEVVITGFQQDVRPLLAACDVMALCSTAIETFSLAALEAMALGKPVVTTGRGGNTDLIDDGVHGLLVPPRDPKALGTALQRLLDDPALAARLGAAARQRVRTEFTIERTLAATDAVYRAALARRPRKASR
jgi:glycosyltransferase involved in cell wall biosynthesis